MVGSTDGVGLGDGVELRALVDGLGVVGVGSGSVHAPSRAATTISAVAVAAPLVICRFLIGKHPPLYGTRSHGGRSTTASERPFHTQLGEGRESERSVDP